MRLQSYGLICPIALDAWALSTRTRSKMCVYCKRLLFRLQTALCIFHLFLCHQPPCTCLLLWRTSSLSRAFGSYQSLRVRKYFPLQRSSKDTLLLRQKDLSKNNYGRMTNTEGIQYGLFMKNDEEQSTLSSRLFRVEEMSANRTRNVRFVSPLLLYGYRPTVDEYENQTLCNKPLLIYLPGFDGTYLSPFLQFPELHTLFDIRCMTVGMNDRSTFDELQADVIQYIQNECQSIATATIQSTDIRTNNSRAVATRPKSISRTPSRRNIYIVGESFGAIMALLVSMDIQRKDVRNDFVLRGLTLINAATCYDRSRLSVEGPKVSDMSDWLYPFGIVSRLLPLFTDQFSLPQLLLILQGKALPSIIDDPCKEAYMGRVAFSLPKVLSFMPRETLQWRLSNWLKEGCMRFGATTPVSQKILLNLDNVRTLVIAGEFDVALPSIAEAERLASTIPNSVIHVVKGAGHATTCGSRIDLAALFRCYFNQELNLPAPISQKKDRNLFTVGLQQIIPWFSESSLSGSNIQYRTQMVEVAANNSGVYFGMLPRYDNSSFGLSPLLYWDKRFYKKLKAITTF